MKNIEINQFPTDGVNNLEDYWSLSYREAKQKFLSIANKVNATVESYYLSALSPENDRLSIDTAILGDLSTAQRIIIITSGVHGVEGFAGSAIQCQILKERDHFPLLEHMCIILVHGVNPYGFSWLRRVNENNINLQRNFHFIKQQKLSGNENHDIPSFYNDNLNTFVPSFSSWYQSICCYFCCMPQISHYMFKGQNIYPDGIEYGGKTIEQSSQYIMNLFSRVYQKQHQNKLSLFHFDIHTGIGSYGKDISYAFWNLLEHQKIFGPKIINPQLILNQKESIENYNKLDEDSLLSPNSTQSTLSSILLSHLQLQNNNPLNQIFGISINFGTCPDYQYTPYWIIKENKFHFDWKLEQKCPQFNFNDNNNNKNGIDYNDMPEKKIEESDSIPYSLSSSLLKEKSRENVDDIDISQYLQHPIKQSFLSKFFPWNDPFWKMNVSHRATEIIHQAYQYFYNNP